MASKNTGVRKKLLFEVRSLDVWGNEEDGFEINQSFRAGQILLPVFEVEYNVGMPQAFKSWDVSDATIVNTMREEGFLRDAVKPSQISIDASEGLEGSMWLNDAETGKPLYELHPIGSNALRGRKKISPKRTSTRRTVIVRRGRR